MWPITYGETFKRYRNTLTSIIRTAKQNYLKTNIIESKGNKKKTWEIINNLLSRNRPQLPSTVTFNNVSVANNDRISELFNDHFCPVASF